MRERGRESCVRRFMVEDSSTKFHSANEEIRSRRKAFFWIFLRSTIRRDSLNRRRLVPHIQTFRVG